MLRSTMSMEEGVVPSTVRSVQNPSKRRGPEQGIRGRCTEPLEASGLLGFDGLGELPSAVSASEERPNLRLTCFIVRTPT